MGLFRDPSPYFGPIALGFVVAAAGAWHRPWRHDETLDRVTTPARPRDAGGSGTLRRRRWLTADASAAARSGLMLAASALVVVSAWPALSGALRLDLAPRRVPARYVHGDRAILAGQPGAVLCVLHASRFAPVSAQHPSVSAIDLQSTSGVGFPVSVEYLEWLNVPRLLHSILENYDINTVVVRDSLTSYRSVSVPSVAARADATSSLRAMPGVAETSPSGLTVLHLSDLPTYPVAVFEEATGRGGSPPSPRPAEVADSVSRPQAELARTSFTDGPAGWGSVGDGNDYLHQAVGQAGIAASVQKQARRRWLELTVRYGDVAISQSLTACPSPGLQTLQIRYRTTRSATVNASVFSVAQPEPIGTVSLPATGGRWVTANVDFVLVPTLLRAFEHVSFTDCEFVLGTQPAVAGMPASAHISSLSLAPSTMKGSASVAETTSPAVRWNAPAHPTSIEMSRTGDSTLTLPPAQHARLVVFWQRYDPGWVATAGGVTTLHHVKVDGWANGYMVPAEDRRLSVSIRYSPQPLSSEGFRLVFAGIAIGVLGGLLTLMRKSFRRHRRFRADGSTSGSR